MPTKVIDLFCGVGGLTHGLQLSGLNVVAGFDFEESCQYAYEKNNDAIFVHKDITELTGHELMEYYEDGDIRILVGCAPCQPFSKYTHRYRKEGHTDSKWQLLYSFGNLIGETLPHIVSMENVPELATQTVFRDFIKKLNDNNYSVSWSIAYAPDYGVPQHRKRLILLATRFNKELHLIDPLYNSETYITVKDAIGELEYIEDGECSQSDIMHQSCKLSEINRKRIRQSIPGGTWREWDEELQLDCHKKSSGKSYPSVYGRMKWDAPSPTITTQFFGFGNGRFGHPEQNRALSLREGAILQSFPPNYKFVPENGVMNKRKIGVQIGNAVPVELGRVIGLSIQEHLKEVGING
ncbi:MAG: DNA (cytosine-5-)-methyltransferase [Muricomes sp.]